MVHRPRQYGSPIPRKSHRGKINFGVLIHKGEQPVAPFALRPEPQKDVPNDHQSCHFDALDRLEHNEMQLAIEYVESCYLIEANSFAEALGILERQEIGTEAVVAHLLQPAQRTQTVGYDKAPL
jgi:hypothetical protein